MQFDEAGGVVDDEFKMNNQLIATIGGSSSLYELTTAWNPAGPNVASAVSTMPNGAYLGQFRIIYRLVVEPITPAGDPVNSPVDGGDGSGGTQDGANDFTYSRASPGVLTLNLKAKVLGIGSMGQAIQDRFKFEVDPIGTSTMIWADDNLGGKATASGDFITATVKFTGLPEHGSDFGKKGVRVTFDGLKRAESTFEAFFPLTARNHPGGQPDSPNWYHYWKQTSANFGTHMYDDYAGTGYTEFVNGAWTAFLSQGIPVGTAAGTWNNAKGIDLFANIARHEATHRSQLQAIWGANSGRAPAEDLDGDRLKDATQSSLLAGRPYDPLNTATYLDTFNYNPSGGYLRDSEDYCLRQQPAWTNGAANSEDWADPGMQHNTLGDPDD